MRASLIAFLVVAAGCSSGTTVPSSQPSQAPQSMRNIQVSGPSAAREYSDLDHYNGQEVTLTGTFRTVSAKAEHGVITLASGLKVSIPHFDHHRFGEAWLQYNGHVCNATGILHTYTKNIDGYRRPTLQLISFSGP